MNESLADLLRMSERGAFTNLEPPDELCHYCLCTFDRLCKSIFELCFDWAQPPICEPDEHLLEEQQLQAQVVLKQCVAALDAAEESEMVVVAVVVVVQGLGGRAG